MYYILLLLLAYTIYSLKWRYTGEEWRILQVDEFYYPQRKTFLWLLLSSKWINPNIGYNFVYLYDKCSMSSFLYNCVTPIKDNLKGAYWTNIQGANKFIAIYKEKKLVKETKVYKRKKDIKIHHPTSSPLREPSKGFLASLEEMKHINANKILDEILDEPLGEEDYGYAVRKYSGNDLRHAITKADRNKDKEKLELLLIEYVRREM